MWSSFQTIQWIHFHSCLSAQLCTNLSGDSSHLGSGSHIRFPGNQRYSDTSCDTEHTSIQHHHPVGCANVRVVTLVVMVWQIKVGTGQLKYNQPVYSANWTRYTLEKTAAIISCRWLLAGWPDGPATLTCAFKGIIRTPTTKQFTKRQKTSSRKGTLYNARSQTCIHAAD